MDKLQTFLSVGQTVGSIGVLICTIIGFIFISKQIKITKNKDIFFNIQTEVSKLIGRYDNLAYEFNSEFTDVLLEWRNDILCDQTQLSRSHVEKSFIFLGQKLKSVIAKYQFAPPNSNQLSLTFYKWWLKENFTPLNDILKGEEFCHVESFFMPYYSLIDKFNLHDVPIKVSFTKYTKADQLIENIFEELDSIQKIYLEKFEKVCTSFDLYLLALSKIKGL